MLSITFDSNTKFKGVCQIIFNENNPIKTFDVVDKNNIIICSYKLKAKVDNYFKLKFFIEDPDTTTIEIPANEDAVQKVISYIIEKETARSVSTEE